MFVRVEPIIDSKWLNEAKMEMNSQGVILGSMSISISVKVIDTEFEETIGELSSERAIIKAYEKHNRSPAKALALYLMQNPSHRELLIRENLFEKYAIEVEKLLMLL